MLDVLSQFVDKSLVVVEEGPERVARYRLLEVVRLYGAERLAEAERTFSSLCEVVVEKEVIVEKIVEVVVTATPYSNAYSNPDPHIHCYSYT